MGCGASNPTSEPIKSIDSSIWQGHLSIQIKEATIQKDLNLLTKMDPYIKIIFGKQRFETPPCEGGGQFPKWENCIFQMNKTNEQDIVLIEVWNKQLLSQDIFVGEGAFSLLHVRQGDNNKVVKNPNIFNKGIEIGNVKIELKFSLDLKSKNHKEVIAPNTKGTIIFSPIKSILLRDVLMFGQMDPLVLAILGDEKQSSSVNTDSGKNPSWIDKLQFQREPKEDIIYIQIWNFRETGNNDLIGTGYLSLTPTLIWKSIIKKNVEIYFEGQVAGNIDIQCEFLTDEPEKYTEHVIQTNNQQNVQLSQLQQQQKQNTQTAPQQIKNFPLQQGQPQQQIYQPHQPQIQQLQPQLHPQQPQFSPYQQQYQSNQPMNQPQQQIPQQIVIQYQQPIQNTPNYYQPINQAQEYRYPNGDLYLGSFMNNKKEGFGKMIYMTGNIYEGQWANDLFNGKGSLIQQGIRYDGDFLYGKKHGKGCQIWPNNQKYDGDWVENNPHGFGLWTFPNGSQKRGEFAKGNRIRWMDEEQNCLIAGKSLMQGQFIISSNGIFSLLMGYDGKIQVINNQSRMIVFQVAQFKRQIFSPYYLRLEYHGELLAIDGSNQPYYTSGKINGIPPFKLVMQDDGKIAIWDSNTVVWVSHL